MKYLLYSILLLSGSVFGQDFYEVQKIAANNRADNDQFGYSAAISGDDALIGSPFEDNDENDSGENELLNSGAAYIYERNGSGVWNQLQKIVASDRFDVDLFGDAVAISGNYIVVGAPFEDENASGQNTRQAAGSAYIYERDGSGVWSQVQKIITPDRTAFDRFGDAVAISGDYIIIGASFEADDALGANPMNSAGSAYIYERDGNGIWNFAQKIVAPDRASFDRFGYAVAISGNYVVITAHLEDEDALAGNTIPVAGSAYVYERNGSGVWSFKQKIVASDRSSEDLFGWSASISGDRIVIGAFNEDEDVSGGNTVSNSGAIYIYERDGSGTWSQTQKIVASDRGTTEDQFGWSVSISGDRIVVGAINEDEDASGMNTFGNAGSAYIYERDGSGTWSEIQKLAASDRGHADSFGHAVAISGDYVLVCANHEDEDASGGAYTAEAGSAYIFDRAIITYSAGVWFGGSGGNGEPTIADENKSAIISDGSPTLGLAAVVNNLSIAQGASLTLPANGSLTVNNELTLNQAEGLVIKSDDSGTGNLITKGSISYQNGGSAKVERFIQENGGSYLEPYHYISTPVNNHAIFNDMSALYAYRESDLTWVHHQDVLDGFSEFSTGIGYAISYSEQTTKSFIGSLNTGNYLVAVTSTENGGSAYQHFNLLGNPYPSSINAESFVSENSSLITNNLYFWNGVDYATYNTSLSSGTAGGLGAIPDGNIAVGQAFFADASSPGNVSFTTGMQGSDSNTFYRKVSFPQLRLQVSSGEEQSDLLLTGHQLSSLEEDRYDAKQLVGDSRLSLASILYGRAYDIESVPELSGHRFDLVVKSSEAKEITFGVTDLQELKDLHVYLEDRKKRRLTDITEGTYTTYVASGEDRHRFKLHIAADQSDYNVWVNDGEVNIFKDGIAVTGKITLIGLDGRIVSSSTSNNISNWSHLPSGIYLLQFENEEDYHVSKIIKR